MITWNLCSSCNWFRRAVLILAVVMENTVRLLAVYNQKLTYSG